MLRFGSILLLFLAPTVYGQIDISVLADLPDAVKETSGLIHVDGKLVTHNDSGNAAELYELDASDGSLLRTVVLNNVVNVDWEDLAQDEDYIYVGDFGNNSGDRRDLKIYRVSKTDFLSSNNIDAEEIGFSYEDQTDFTSNSETNWDAEALVSYQGNLLVFTKQWSGMGTTAYQVSNSPGNHTALRLDSYQVNGLVTGATFNQESNQIVLVGYSRLLSPFVVRVENPQPTAIFSGAVTKFQLDVGVSQMEGIAVYEGGYFTSSEGFGGAIPSIFPPSRLYSFNFEEEPSVEPEPEPEPEPTPNPDPQGDGGMGNQLILYQPQGSTFLNYYLSPEMDLFGYAIFDASGRRIMDPTNDSELIGSIDTSLLRPSIYFVSFYLRSGRIAKPFIIQ